MLLLCGKTAAGKDTIKAQLIKLGMKPVVTYTTRPMRENEVEGVNYHYISKEKFNELDFENFFAETTSYNVASGETWYYGTSKESLDKDTVIIVNPDGLKKLIEYKELEPVVVYINCDEPTIWNRLRLRGDDNTEARRRINADDIDFEGIIDYTDLSIKNDQNLSTDYIAKLIYDYYQERIK